MRVTTRACNIFAVFVLYANNTTPSLFCWSIDHSCAAICCCCVLDMCFWGRRRRRHRSTTGEAASCRAPSPCPAGQGIVAIASWWPAVDDHHVLLFCVPVSHLYTYMYILLVVATREYTRLRIHSCCFTRVWTHVLGICWAILNI